MKIEVYRNTRNDSGVWIVAINGHIFGWYVAEETARFVAECLKEPGAKTGSCPLAERIKDFEASQA